MGTSSNQVDGTPDALRRTQEKERSRDLNVGKKSDEADTTAVWGRLYATDAAVLDRDPVFLPYRSRPEFSALQKVLEGRMRAAREALESGTVSVKVAAAGVSGPAGPDPEVGGLR